MYGNRGWGRSLWSMTGVLLVQAVAAGGWLVEVGGTSAESRLVHRGLRVQQDHRRRQHRPKPRLVRPQCTPICCEDHRIIDYNYIHHRRRRRRDTKGRGFDSWPFHFQVITLGKLFTHTCASVTEQYNLVPVKGR